jgi:hypothetical protein
LPAPASAQPDLQKRIPPAVRYENGLVPLRYSTPGVTNLCNFLGTRECLPRFLHSRWVRGWAIEHGGAYLPVLWPVRMSPGAGRASGQVRSCVISSVFVDIYRGFYTTGEGRGEWRRNWLGQGTGLNRGRVGQRIMGWVWVGSRDDAAGCCLNLNLTLCWSAGFGLRQQSCRFDRCLLSTLTLT